MIPDNLKKALKDLEVTDFLESELILYSESAKYNRSDFFHFFIPGEEKKLSSYWKKQSNFLRFINNNIDNISDIKYFLSSIPNISNILSGKELEPYDIFDVKKFIKNLRKISEIYKPYQFKGLKFIRTYESLWKLLNIGQDYDHFVVSSEYSKSLFNIRVKIREVTTKLKTYKIQFLDSFSNECDLPRRLSEDEFTISSDSLNLKKILDSKYTLLLDDRASFLKFKLVYPKNINLLSKRLNTLLLKQKNLEQKVLKRLNKAILKHKDRIIEDSKILLEWENLFSLALLYKKYNMHKPGFANKCIQLNMGRFIPLNNYLDEKRLKYTPIDIKIKHYANLITGSNMGGKTQALKTIGFFQSLFQLGVFVPADKFNSHLFENIFYCSSEDLDNSRGLSSFGAEINFIIKNFNPQKKHLFLLDEFARTTNVHEGIALNNALLKSFLNSLSTVILTGHFKLNQKDCGFFKVGGLKKEDEFRDYFSLNKSDGLRILNSLMDYNIYIDKSNEISEEAIRVAEIMGLDADIIKSARNFMKK